MFIGEKWKERRSLITPAFHVKMLEGSYLDVFNKRGIDYRNRLENLITENKIKEVDWSVISFASKHSFIYYRRLRNQSAIATITVLKISTAFFRLIWI